MAVTPIFPPAVSQITTIRLKSMTKTKQIYGYKCLECGWGPKSRFSEPEKALSALSAHVGKTDEGHIGWSEYLVKHGFHECEDCGTPLDTKIIDRCYCCRMKAKGLEEYIDTDGDTNNAL